MPVGPHISISSAKKGINILASLPFHASQKSSNRLLISAMAIIN
jgi:hypothetical protein